MNLFVCLPQFKIGYVIILIKKFACKELSQLTENNQEKISKCNKWLNIERWKIYLKEFYHDKSIYTSPDVFSIPGVGAISQCYNVYNMKKKIQNLY